MTENKLQSQGFEIVIYEAADGSTKLEVNLDGETVWLTQAQMAELFGVNSQAITKHLQNIYAEGELDESATCSKMEQVRREGSRNVKRTMNAYNLDAVISVGYRVNSKRATHFRRWATSVLHDYIVKGFAMDDNRLKEGGGGTYWRELLDRIRDIRSSEKVLYRQVLDIYATAVDYDPSTEESRRFFKIVQNKLHYSAHGHTAAEVIYERANADDLFMGLRTFKGEHVTLEDARIAKNYLDEEELRTLNSLVSGFFDIAETRARQHIPTYMADYIEQLDVVLQVATGRPVLEGAGSVSHAKAIERVEEEYRKYEQRTLSPVEVDYLESLKTTQRELEQKDIFAPPSKDSD